MEKSVLLFSGGFDSMLQEWLIHPDVLLYVDMKTSYSEREIEFLRTLPAYYTERLIIKELPIGEYERENKYLPYRNLLLATIAMQYGQHVYFGFNSADNAPDKDDVFLKRMTTLFRHLNKQCVWDMGWDNKKFSFSAPFTHLTKSEMVKQVLADGMSPEQVQGIRSCYSSESKKGCGVCRPCVKRAVALINNGLYEDRLFDHPITVEILTLAKEEILSDIANGFSYPPNYADETERALRTLRQANQ